MWVSQTEQNREEEEQLPVIMECVNGFIVGVLLLNKRGADDDNIHWVAVVASLVAAPTRGKSQRVRSFVCPRGWLTE